MLDQLPHNLKEHAIILLGLMLLHSLQTAEGCGYQTCVPELDHLFKLQQNNRKYNSIVNLILGFYLDKN